MRSSKARLQLSVRIVATIGVVGGMAGLMVPLFRALAWLTPKFEVTQAVLEPWPLAVALLAALVTVLILRFALDPVFNLFGVEWRASDLPGSKNQEVPNESNR